MAHRGELFDYDPVTGIADYYEEHADGTISIHSVQDVEPMMDVAMRLRNEGHSDAAWKKQGGCVYATLPLGIVGHMMQRGINVFDPNDLAKVVHEVNTTYSKFKTTDKHHEL